MFSSHGKSLPNIRRLCIRFYSDGLWRRFHSQPSEFSWEFDTEQRIPNDGI